MDFFNYRNSELFCEDLQLAALAEKYGTPSYIYSNATLLRHCRRLIKAFENYPTTACFAVKSNSNHTILKTIFSEGLGADLVSAGELDRSLRAGVTRNKIVFSGVGKLDSEIILGLESDILSFNVESDFELRSIERLAKARRKTARISLRINPNIDAKTNEKIATGLYSTKFGIPETELAAHLQIIKESKHLNLVGVACHIGSQITDLAPLREAAFRMASIAKDVMAAGFPLEMIDMGGGVGIKYSAETQPVELEDYAAALIEAMKPTGLHLVIEPGRVLVGNIGVLLTRVIGVKKTPEKNFVILDAAMNDLMRPTLYGSFHDIIPVIESSKNSATICDFVGPICETGDFLGKDRLCPVPEAGDLFAIRGCGAYAAIMANTYNSRAIAPEILVIGPNEKVVKRRQTPEEIWIQEIT